MGADRAGVSCAGAKRASRSGIGWLGEMERDMAGGMAGWQRSRIDGAEHESAQSLMVEVAATFFVDFL